MNILDKKIGQLISDDRIKKTLIKDGLIVDNPMVLASIKDVISLRDILRQKGLNPDDYSQKLQFVQGAEKTFDITLDTDITGKNNREASVFVKGVLPCPVRVPLLEAVADYRAENKAYFNDVAMELNPASMGLDWMKDDILTEDEDKLLDMFISAGYDVFFDKKYIGKFKDRDVFSDISGVEEYGVGFERFKDPKSVYMMIGVVPAVFIVHLDELNGRTVPSSWEDILSEDFESSIAVPMGDFDLFNALLLGINHLFGKGGVEKLARNTLKSCHPSEMLKPSKISGNAAISIMPYFFTRMNRPNMKAVWPEEGSIVSPIFMLAKKSKAKKLKILVDLFMGDRVANILAGEGYFPSVKKGVQNKLMGNGTFVFPDWEFLNGEDVGKVLEELDDVFKRNLRI